MSQPAINKVDPSTLTVDDLHKPSEEGALAGLTPPSQEDLPRMSSMEAGCYVSFAIAIIFVGARIYARCFLMRSFGLDDMFIVFAAFMSLAIIITVPIMFRLGIGKHVEGLPIEDFLIARQWAWISQIFYYAALTNIKLAIIALYHRIATQKRHKLLLKIIGALVLGHGLCAVIVTAHMCDPIELVWKPSFPIGCIKILEFNCFNAAASIIADLVLAFLPIPILRGLQINRRKKIGLIIIFAVGALTVVCTIARQITNAMAMNNLDFSWYWAPAELCTCIEVNMGLICTSVPALRPLFRGVIPATKGSSGDKYDLETGTRTHRMSQRRSRQDPTHHLETGKIVEDDDGRITHGYTTRIFLGRSVGGAGGAVDTSDARPSSASSSSGGSESNIIPSPGVGQVMKNVEYRVEYSNAA